MVEFNKNIWAPWRMEYINQLSENRDGCFLCDARDTPDQDDKNFVLWRGRYCLAMFNRFPYTSGHMLVAPFEHKGSMCQLSDQQMTEMMQFTRDLQLVLIEVTKPGGFNVGMNFGHCAGAGLPDHLHLHLVPRWAGDTNFMTVTGDVRIIPQAIDKLFKELRKASTKLSLPKTD